MANKTRRLLESPDHIETQMAILNDPDLNRGTKRYLRINEACEYAQIGKTKMYELINSGVVVAKKAGRSTLVDLDSLDRFLANLPALRVRENAIRRRWGKKRKAGKNERL